MTANAEWLQIERVNPKAIAQKAFDAFLTSYGASRCPIDPCADDFEFVQRYGLEIDGRPFDFRAYKHLEDVYRDTSRFIVLMAAAQTGKSARIFAYILRQMMVNWGRSFGYYLPTIDMASKFSQTRFSPFVRSQVGFRKLIGAHTQKGRGIDNVLTRTIGESTLFFMTTAGRTSTEGLPLQGVLFDEVRRMVRGDIERAMERYSAQEAPTDLKASTAMFPDADIDLFFKDGDQRYFHTACDCPDGVVLSLTYPDCILDLRGAPNELRKAQNLMDAAGRPNLGRRADEVKRYPPAIFQCPKCSKMIVDPQDGWWQAHNPGAFVHSYQMPQLLSPNFSAGRVLFRHENALDVQEFHNSVLGLPYLDEESRPIKLEHLLACVDTSLRWPAMQPEAWRRRNVANTSVGVDVQRGYLVVVMLQRAANRKMRVIHLEVLVDGGDEGESMWKKLGRLILEWDADITTIDNAPEWTEADRFARAFPGRVWLASYDTSGSPTAPLAAWGDKGQGQNAKKQAGKEMKFTRNVIIHRVKGLKWMLGRWVNRQIEIPDPAQLVQRLPVIKGKVVFSGNLRRGKMVAVPIARMVLFEHLLQFMFRDLYDEPDEEDHRKRGDSKMVAEYIGKVDPHFAHAMLYAAVGLARKGMRA